MKNTRKNFMKLAVKQAAKSIGLSEVPVGCVIVDGNGEIIGSGYNASIEKNDPTLHAEIMAIRKACKKRKNTKLLDCSLYVTLQPCTMCEAAIFEAGIKKVYFGSYSDSFKNFSDLKNKYHKELNGYIYYGGIEEEKCTSMLKVFFKKLR